MIYKFVFVGCRANVWLDCFTRLGEYIEKREGRCRRKLYKKGQLCYEHFEGGFGLLTTCHIVHIEAFQLYWSETVLTVQGYYRNLQRTCSYLPLIIKENLRHLRDVALPEDRGRHLTRLHELHKTPQLLRQFPKLVSCEFQQMPGVHVHDYSRYEWRAESPLGLPDSESLAQLYHPFGRFNLKNGQSLATYLEGEMGVRPSCGVIILSKAIGVKYRGHPRGYKNLVSPILTYLSNLK